jgi:hypothetical protein
MQRSMHLQEVTKMHPARTRWGHQVFRGHAGWLRIRGAWGDPVVTGNAVLSGDRKPGGHAGPATDGAMLSSGA